MPQAAAFTANPREGIGVLGPVQTLCVCEPYSGQFLITDFFGGVGGGWEKKKCFKIRCQVMPGLSLRCFSSFQQVLQLAAASTGDAPSTELQMNAPPSKKARK